MKALSIHPRNHTAGKQVKSNTAKPPRQPMRPGLKKRHTEYDRRQRDWQVTHEAMQRTKTPNAFRRPGSQKP